MVLPELRALANRVGVKGHLRDAQERGLITAIRDRQNGGNGAAHNGDDRGEPAKAESAERTDDAGPDRRPGRFRRRRR